MKGVSLSINITDKHIEEIVETYSNMLIRIAFNNLMSLVDAEDIY